MKKEEKKVSLWQFFTKERFWIKPHIIDFINATWATIAFDPFAGGGDLLEAALELWFEKIIWYDIDEDLEWEMNDSLLYIPKIENAIIITNPPYLSNYSAARKWIINNVKKYFDSCHYDDLYQLAIEKCMENNDYWIMIIPETFINSNFPKNRLVSITVIEDMMFHDTENPICVICYDSRKKWYDEIKVFKNNEYISTLFELESKRKYPNKKVWITFNSLQWQIALRAVDTTNIDKPIKFLKPCEIDYDLTSIKESSRLITLIEIDWVMNEKINEIIDISNSILNKFRSDTSDILLSPFKWNKKNWERRRRLDYKTARAILEEAYYKTSNINYKFF